METIVPQDTPVAAKPVRGASSSRSPAALRDTSSSRASLRERLSERRSALTEREHSFLEHLCVHGEEIEVQLAHERLLDTDLFFDSSQPKTSAASNLITNTDAIFKTEQQPRHTLPQDASGESSVASLGASSQRRLEVLEERRKAHEKMWKAHSTGLALTPQGSRRSMAARRQSLSSLSSSRMDLYHRPETEAIFRHYKNMDASALGNGALDDFIRPDNNRRAASIQLPPKGIPFARRENSSGQPNSPTRASLRNPARPSFRRMMSDGSRKSVSFRLDPPEPGNFSGRIKSEGCATNKPTFEAASDSLPSIPIIKKETPARSGSIASNASSVNDPPSIHHANRIASVSSIPSLPRGHTLSSQSSVEGDPPSIHQANGVFSISSIPSLHQGNALSSQSSVGLNTIVHQKPTSSVETLDDEWGEVKQDPPMDGAEKARRFQQQQLLGYDNDDDQPMGISATKLLSHDDPNDAPFGRLVLMRRASRHALHNMEQGIEVSPYVDAARRLSFTQSSIYSGDDVWDERSLKTSYSFDETLQHQQQRSIFRRTSALKRSLSDDKMAGIFSGGAARRLLNNNDMSNSMRQNTEINGSLRGNILLIPNESSVQDDDDSYNLDNEDPLTFYDPWKVIEDEYENGYGGGGTLPFRIIGTSGDDLSAQPHVLSPPLMESLHAFLPQAVSGDNYWLKYSMVRDGASMVTFLQHARGANYAILAIETVDGEVFGAFTVEAWRKNWNFFGGGESFLWRMRHSRQERCLSIIDQAQQESEIDVFLYSGQNTCIQLCTHDKIAIGGGSGDPAFENAPRSPTIKAHDWGFGLALENDMLHGSSSPCITFSSPSLSNEHSDGSLFEIVNMELWTFTPCLSLEDAEKLELASLFLRKHAKETFL